MSNPLSKQIIIEEKLRKALTPLMLEVINESHLHAGHHHSDNHRVSFDGLGETHFRVRIITKAFAGMSRVERHRVIYTILKDEIANGVHALALEPFAPDETSRK